MNFEYFEKVAKESGAEAVGSDENTREVPGEFRFDEETRKEKLNKGMSEEEIQKEEKVIAARQAANREERAA